MYSNPLPPVHDQFTEYIYEELSNTYSSLEFQNQHICCTAGIKCIYHSHFRFFGIRQYKLRLEQFPQIYHIPFIIIIYTYNIIYPQRYNLNAFVQTTFILQSYEFMIAVYFSKIQWRTPVTNCSLKDEISNK